LFEEDAAPKTKKRCFKIARKGLSTDILHRIDYGKPQNHVYKFYNHYHYYWKKEDLICCADFDLPIK